MGEAPASAPAENTERGLGLIFAGFGSLGFGLMMAVIMLAYARDLTLPVLLAVNLIGLLAGAVLLAMGRIKRKSTQQQTH